MYIYYLNDIFIGQHCLKDKVNQGPSLLISALLSVNFILNFYPYLLPHPRVLTLSSQYFLTLFRLLLWVIVISKIKLQQGETLISLPKKKKADAGKHRYFPFQSNAFICGISEEVRQKKDGSGQFQILFEVIFHQITFTNKVMVLNCFSTKSHVSHTSQPFYQLLKDLTKPVILLKWHHAF